MKFTKLKAFAAVTVAAVTWHLDAAAQATAPDQKPAVRQKWESMSPEQQAAAKEKVRARWAAMTPEERAAAKKQFAERHPRAAAKLADKRQSEAPVPASK